MNRPTISLLATVGALLALTGLAAVGSGDEPADAGASEAAERPAPRPVQRTALTCPRPTAAESATTWYTAYTPAGEPAGEEGQGSAELFPAPEYAPGTEGGEGGENSGGGENGEGGEDGNGEGGENGEGQRGQESQEKQADPVAPLAEPGVPVTVSTEETGAPALTGTAEQRLAPGWTVQQTTRVPSGIGRGLLGTACQTPDTGFWFAGASTAATRHDYVHVTNPDEAATVVDVELYGPDGRLEAEAGEGITVPGGSSVPVLLSTLTDEEVDDLAVEVTARTGRIGAQIEAVDDALGADWLPPADPADGPVVLPGIPADARNAQLVAYAPGEEDITFDVRLAGPAGVITPAGHETVTVLAGSLTTVDLGPLTQGETGSLVLTPAAGSGGGSVMAALRVTEGPEEQGEEGEGESGQEMAFIQATDPIEWRGTASGNTAEGVQLSLAALGGEAARVEVTVSAGSDGGRTTTQSYTVKPRTTLTVTPELPEDTEGRYALTVERLGGGPLYAARTLSEGGGEEDDSARMVTIQTIPDDRSTVTVPDTGQDLSILIE
ncbi:DUF5719 family protein [Streptomyces sp. 6N223]|uniref:DUF5719 family protein n=1 Tax=Streptomyces sp. 6N223 TaxID=3457412 RepID=UPI003FD64742